MPNFFKFVFGKIPENFWKALIGTVSVTVLGWAAWIWDDALRARALALLRATKDAIVPLISVATITAAISLTISILACVVIYFKQRELRRYRSCERMFEKAAIDYADIDYKIFQHLFIDVGELLARNVRVINALRTANEIQVLQRIGGSALSTIEDSIVTSLDHAAGILGAHCGFRCSVTIKMYTGAYVVTSEQRQRKEVRTIDLAYSDKASIRKLDRGIIQREDETPFNEIANLSKEYYMRSGLANAAGYKDSDRDSGFYNSIVVLPILSLPDKKGIAGFIQADSVDGDIANESCRHYLAETAWRAAVLLVRVKVLETERIRLHSLGAT